MTVGGEERRPVGRQVQYKSLRKAASNHMLPLILEIAAVVIVAIVVFQSFHNIGPAQVGLVTKKIARKSLAEGNPVARRGEAGYQERLLMPGLRFRLWPI